MDTTVSRTVYAQRVETFEDRPNVAYVRAYSKDADAARGVPQSLFYQTSTALAPRVGDRLLITIEVWPADKPLPWEEATIKFIGDTPRRTSTADIDAP